MPETRFLRHTFILGITLLLLGLILGVATVPYAHASEPCDLVKLEEKLTKDLETLEELRQLAAQLEAFGVSTVAILDQIAIIETLIANELKDCKFHNLPPTLWVPLNITVEGNTTGGYVGGIGTASAGSGGGSDPNPVIINNAPTFFPLGTTIVTWTATNANGISVSKTQTVTVVDRRPPVIRGSVPGAVEANGPSGSIVTFSITATDVVGMTSGPTCTPPSGSLFAIGDTTVRCTAIDTVGNVRTVSFTIMVIDRTAPDVTVPADITVEADRQSGSIVTFSVTATDTVGVTDGPVCGPRSGIRFPIGDTTVTCRARDARGNVGTASFTVSVVDTTVPDVTTPADITVEADGPSGSIVTFNVTATDDVGVTSGPTCTPSSGSLFAIGDTTVVCTASDAAVNTGTASFTVSVVDTTPPDVTAPSNEPCSENLSDLEAFVENLENFGASTAQIEALKAAIAQVKKTCTVQGNFIVDADGPSGLIMTFGVTATDDVGVTSEPTCAPSSGSLFAIGDTTVVCTASDAAGNVGSASFTVSVAGTVDTTAPDVTVPGNITVEADGPTGSIVTFSVTATDDVGVTSGPTCTPSSGSLFAIGDTTVVCTASDAAGNTGTASFTVSVVDTTPPDVTVPADVTVEADGPTGSIVTFSVTATDDVGVTSGPTCTPSSDSLFAIGDTTVTCTATDAAGNVGKASFSVSVVDTTDPALVNPDSFTVEGTTANGATVALPASTATDIVDPAPAVVCDQSSGFFPLGDTTVNCTATDASDNSDGGSYIVTVIDTTDPTITAPSNITVITNTVGAYIGPIGTPTVSDIADPSPTVDSAPIFILLGNTDVVWTATDGSGNSASDSHTVTVIPVPLSIDIKPGSDTNSLNLNGNGVLPVAILGTDTVNVRDIKISSLRLGVNGTEEEVVHEGHIEDVNNDGVDDLVIHLRKADLGIDLTTDGNTNVPLTLTGQFNDGRDLEGIDDVRITPSNSKARGKGGKGPK